MDTHIARGLLDKLVSSPHLDRQLDVLLLNAARLRSRPRRVVRESLCGLQHVGGVSWVSGRLEGTRQTAFGG